MNKQKRKMIREIMNNLNDLETKISQVANLEDISILRAPNGACNSRQYDHMRCNVMRLDKCRGYINTILALLEDTIS